MKNHINVPSKWKRLTSGKPKHSLHKKKDKQDSGKYQNVFSMCIQILTRNKTGVKIDNKVKIKIIANENTSSIIDINQNEQFNLSSISDRQAASPVDSSPFSEAINRSSSAVNIGNKKYMSKLHTDFEYEPESERKRLVMITKQYTFDSMSWTHKYLAYVQAF